MKFIIATTPLFTTALGAVLAPALETLTIPVPPGAEPYTSTVPACGTVNAFAVVAVPNGTFIPGTTTIFLPPQASATTQTFFDPSGSDVEVVIATPLEGSCAPFDITPTSTFTDIGQLTATGSDGTPTATDSACPLGTLAAGVDKAAQQVIDAINKVTLISQNLQAAAKNVGGNAQKRDDDDSISSNENALAVRQFNTPIIQVASGLRDVVTTLTSSIPRITVLPPFDPGDASDAIVIALISFVRVHQALLNILIGRSGLIANFPFGETAGTADPTAQQLQTIVDEMNQFLAANVPAGQLAEVNEARDVQFNPIGAPIAAMLRQIEKVVDALAFAIIRLIPSRNECAKEQKSAIDGTLDESIAAYS